MTIEARDFARVNREKLAPIVWVTTALLALLLPTKARLRD
jgi:hypothetical protein